MQTCKSGLKVPVLHGKNTQTRAGTHVDLSFWRKSSCFARKKRQVMCGTHRDLLCLSKRRCLHPTTIHEGWNPYRLVILTLGTLFCMQKITGEVLDP